MYRIPSILPLNTAFSPRSTLQLPEASSLLQVRAFDLVNIREGPVSPRNCPELEPSERLVKQKMPVPLATSTPATGPSTSSASPPIDLSFKPYPASTRTASAVISSIPTTATYISFSDRILVTITQEGRLAQWLQVPLDTSGPTGDDPYFHTIASIDEDGLLPGSEFAPKSLLGGAAGTGREVLGNLYASQIASAVKVKDLAEKRVLVVGLGLVKAEVGDSEAFAEVIDLVLKVL